MSFPSPEVARAVLQRVGEAGQPPEVGIEHLNVGNESVLGVLAAEYLEPIARSGRGSSFKLVQAYYGGGKTHFLLCARQRAWTLGMCSALVGLSPEECPFDDSLRTYAAVARELAWPPADPACAPARGIELALGQALEERRAQLGDDGVAEWLDRQVRVLPVDAPSWRAAMVAFFRARLSGDLDREELAAAWLRGEEVPVSEVRALGIREAITRESGFRMLRSLCQALQGIGAPGLLLCFDELDRTLSLPPRRRRAIADNLRQLIDLCGREQLPGLLCLYAVPPEFMTSVVAEYPALQQRLKGPAALSERSPQAALIDLENLDLKPEELLAQIGLRLVALFRVAYDPEVDAALQEENLRALAREVLESSFEVAHRRAYVKAAVDLLHGQRVKPASVSRSELRRLAGRAAELVAVSPSYEEF
ncbi:MAG: BREX system ATP-binding domain-containing protein [Myxococcota bacterium]